MAEVVLDGDTDENFKSPESFNDVGYIESPDLHLEWREAIKKISQYGKESCIESHK